MQTFDCIVVGAGISGLSAAYTLQQRGARVLLVEALARTGGLLNSEQTDDGFVLEHGAQTVSNNDPALWEHFDELGIASELLVAGNRRVYMPVQGRLERLSFSLAGLVGSRLLSSRAKLRLLLEPVLPRATTADESVAHFFTRRLGAEFTRRIIDPFVSGVFGGDSSLLSVRAMFPNLWKLEQHHGSLLRGWIANKNSQAAPPNRGRRQTFNFRHGMQTWADALVRALPPAQVWTSTRAVALQPVEQCWHLTVVRGEREEVIQASHVVLAVPADVAARLVDPLEPAASQALQAVRYPPLAMVYTGYRRSDVAHPLDGLGVLCPWQEQRRILGMLWISTVFPTHAPDGMVLTTAFVGGTRAPDLARQEKEGLLEMVKHEQQELIGAHGAPVLAHVAYWKRSVPQYDARYAHLIEMCNRLEARWPGLYLASNYRHGFSVTRCWQQSRALAARITLKDPVRELSSSS
jgi:protoporphyrinogen/coproporphyrinogen III oxidase